MMQRNFTRFPTGSHAFFAGTFDIDACIYESLVLKNFEGTI